MGRCLWNNDFGRCTLTSLHVDSSHANTLLSPLGNCPPTCLPVPPHLPGAIITGSCLLGVMDEGSSRASQWPSVLTVSGSQAPMHLLWGGSTRRWSWTGCPWAKQPSALSVTSFCGFQGWSQPSVRSLTATQLFQRALLSQ